MTWRAPFPWQVSVSNGVFFGGVFSDHIECHCMRPWEEAKAHLRRGAVLAGLGRPVQVDPIKPNLKAPGTNLFDTKI